MNHYLSCLDVGSQWRGKFTISNNLLLLLAGDEKRIRNYCSIDNKALSLSWPDLISEHIWQTKNPDVQFWFLLCGKWCKGKQKYCVICILSVDGVIRTGGLLTPMVLDVLICSYLLHIGQYEAFQTAQRCICLLCLSGPWSCIRANQSTCWLVAPGIVEIFHNN